MYKDKSLDWYCIDDPSGVYEYMSQSTGEGVPGADIIDTVTDSELMQIQDCIKLLTGFRMENDDDVCDISSLTEFDMANLMAFIGHYFETFIGEEVYAGEPPEDWSGPWHKYMKVSDMYAAAYKYFGVDIEGVFNQLSIYSPPEDSKVGWRYQGNVETINGVECVDVEEQIDASPAFTPYIEHIYSLSDDCSYVLYKYYDDYSADNKPCTKPLKKLTIESKKIRYGYAIMRNRIENGEKHYYIERCGLKSKSFMTMSELGQYASSRRENSNIRIDYSKVKDCTDIQRYMDYLAEVIGEIKPNDSAKYDIARYIEYAIEHCCTVRLKSAGKKITIDSTCIDEAIASATEVRTRFERFLTDRNIVLNKKIKITIRIECIKVRLKKGVTVTFDDSLLNDCDRFDEIRVVFDKQCQAVYATASQIKGLLENNANSICVHKTKNNYRIKYIGKNKEDIERVDEAITFIFKADSALDTVYFQKDDANKLNWGGQIDDNNDTIEFNSGISGVYYIEKNEPNISDIDLLNDEQREAIEFLVSRGFMELSEGEFRPYMSLSRYDFTRAIVGLFYDLNLYADCTFPDVDIDNVYYSYIASAQEKNTVVGYEDDTFRGDNHTTREEVISIASRTLANKKGYLYPENTDEYIRFADKELIQGWDNQYEEIALAVREGLINNGGVLAPQMNITRVDAALILYRLFNLLYDTTPTRLATATDGGDMEVPIVPIAVGGGVGVAGISGIFIYIFRRKFI